MLKFLKWTAITVVGLFVVIMLMPETDSMKQTRIAQEKRSAERSKMMDEDPCYKYQMFKKTGAPQLQLDGMKRTCDNWAAEQVKKVRK